MDAQFDYKRLIEAALFMSPNALSAQELSGITGVKSTGHIESMLRELAQEYDSSGTALQVLEIDKKYMLTLREPYASRVSGLARGPDITKGALRVLAYVSENDSVLQSRLVKIFGGSTYDHVKELLEQGFVERRKQGRSWRLGVTNKFREYFSANPSRQDATP